MFGYCRIPWLPFIPYIDLFPPVVFQRTLQIVFVISALAIVFNRRVQLSALALGATMLIAVVSSKAYYGNNKTLCGLMLFLAGLYQPGGPPFLRWQLAITYFGAGLNKALDGDCQTGVFFENWAVNRLQQPWYIALDAILPTLVLARIVCWTTIVTELGTVPCLLIPSLYYWGILANSFFQSSLLLFTGTTFTLSFYSMTAASLAFVTWPNGPLPILYDPSGKFGNRARKFFQPWDLDLLFVWAPYDPSVGAKFGIGGDGVKNGLHLVTADKVYAGFEAVRMMVLLNPITYFASAVAIAALGDLPGAAVLGRRLIVGTCLVLLMPPLARIADVLCWDSQKRAARP